MADSAARPLKRCLGDVTMRVARVRQGCDKTYSILRWKIEKFLVLKDTVRYKCRVKTLDWILKLDKKRYSVTVTIKSESEYGATKGYVFYEPQKFSDLVTFEQVSGGMYKAQFGPKIVNHKHNAILNKHGCLVLYILIEMKWNMPKDPCAYPEKRCRADEDILNREVSKCLVLCRSSTGIQLTDFVIVVEEKKYYAHKAILRMRSPFFGFYIDKFCKDGEKGYINIQNTIPEVVDRVLLYIYKGSSEVPKDIDLRIRIFELAHFFCIFSLWSAYVDLLIRDINETNVVRIKNAGMSTGTRSLIEAADSYFSEYRRSISGKDSLSTVASEHSSIISFK